MRGCLGPSNSSWGSAGEALALSGCFDSPRSHSSSSNGENSSLTGSVRRRSSSSAHLVARGQFASALRMGVTTGGWSSLQAFTASSSTGNGGMGSGSTSAGAAVQ
eukprot:GHRQ01002512.1.p3 GENE.GHRQ01002512.1~~GHRQ01002512.1.p3  ORF type:complete len:105 (+),score=56.49 GHRQ01002512.1:521-835(+)